MNHTDDATAVATNTTRGVAIAQDGYLLSPIAAPGEVGETGRLSFRIIAADGSALADYAVSHDQQLHLIVVRTDGTQFRHVHPTLDADGVWSLPWSWNAAGTYRVYADFVPADTADGTDHLDPHRRRGRHVHPRIRRGGDRTSSIDGFDVTLDGELPVGSDSHLTVTITRDGEAGHHPAALPGRVRPPGGAARGRPGLPARPPRGRRARRGRPPGPTVTFMARRPPPGATCCTWTSRSTGRSTPPRSSSTPPATWPARPPTTAPLSRRAVPTLTRHGTRAMTRHGR